MKTQDGFKPYQPFESLLQADQSGEGLGADALGDVWPLLEELTWALNPILIFWYNMDRVDFITCLRGPLSVLDSCLWIDIFKPETHTYTCKEALSHLAVKFGTMLTGITPLQMLLFKFCWGQNILPKIIKGTDHNKTRLWKLDKNSVTQKVLRNWFRD